MPFGPLERPSLALGLLQSHCRRLDVACTTRYLNMLYAARIGIEEYIWLGSDVPYTAFAGDWIFAEALYGSRPDDDARYVEDVLRGTWLLDDDDVERIMRARDEVEPFLVECLEAVTWDAYTLVGFTSVFQQNIASLALAARVKEAR